MATALPQSKKDQYITGELPSISSMDQPDGERVPATEATNMSLVGTTQREARHDVQGKGENT
jgi:hypothetical protein